MASDLEVLLDMGFEKARAELAVKKSGGLQGALAWLEETQDKPLEELQAAAAEEEGEEGGPSVAALEGDDVLAKSLVCNECGKQFRTHALATFHAEKTLVSTLLTPACNRLLTFISASTQTSPSPLMRSRL